MVKDDLKNSVSKTDRAYLNGLSAGVHGTLHMLTALCLLTKKEADDDDIFKACMVESMRLKVAVEIIDDKKISTKIIGRLPVNDNGEVAINFPLTEDVEVSE